MSHICSVLWLQVCCVKSPWADKHKFTCKGFIVYVPGVKVVLHGYLPVVPPTHLLQLSRYADPFSTPLQSYTIACLSEHEEQPFVVVNVAPTHARTISLTSTAAHIDKEYGGVNAVPREVPEQFT